MMENTLIRRARRATPVGAMALVMTALSACGVQDSLLEQQQPQIVRPSDIQNAAGALNLYNGGLSRFRTALNGGDNNQESIWGFEGLMTDEFQSADSFSQRNDADQRRTQTQDGVMQVTYERVQQSRGYARDAINSLVAYSPTETAKIAEMYMMMGFMETTLGEAFCNGIPLGQTIGDQPQYTVPLTNADVFKTAITRFDSALTVATGTDATSDYVRTATRLAKARTLVNLALFDSAANVVQGIPTSYVYLITYSQTTQSNEWWQMSTSSKRYSVGDSVDPTGKQRILNSLPYYSAGDPRVKVKANPGVNGLDTKTPFTELTNWGREDPIALVAGIDARLIEAEAQLRTQTPAGFAAMNKILNDLRAAPPKYGNLTIAPITPALAVPATYDAAIDQFFREKAFWQFGRGIRMSDLRRLTRQYGRDPETVWPTGPFQPLKGGAFGKNVAFPVPDAERANPNFKGCLDTKA
jgi:hypothetical protein